MTIHPNADLLTQDWLLQGELERLATRSEREFMHFTLLSEFSEWNGRGGREGGGLCVSFITSVTFFFSYLSRRPSFFCFTDGEEAKNNTTTCTNTVEIYKKKTKNGTTHSNAGVWIWESV